MAPVEWDWGQWLRAALKAGVSVQQFWDLTPHELEQVLDVASDAREREADMLATVAWYTAMLTRAKRIPPLRRLLDKHKPQKPLNVEERAERQREFDELSARMAPYGR